MISFIEFLIERERPLNKALKLGSYLAKRHAKKAGWNSPIILHKSYKPSDAAHAWKTYDSKHGHIKGHNPFLEQPTTKIPIKHLKVTQDSTEFDHSYAKSFKAKDKRPIHVMKHGNNHYIVDGHHRVMLHKLLGKKEINAKVIHIK